MFQTKIVAKIITHILHSTTPPPPPENCAVYEIMWKKYGTAGQATDGNIIRRMRVACWITKATDTRVILTAPRQLWLRERASVLYVY
jgi:hypothetical protein